MKKRALILIVILFLIIVISNCTNANNIQNIAPENGSVTPIIKNTSNPSPTSIPSISENFPEFALYGKSQLPRVLSLEDDKLLFVLDGSDLKLLDAENFEVVKNKSNICEVPECTMKFMGKNDAFLLIVSSYGYTIYNAGTLDKIVQKSPVIPINNNTDEMILETLSSVPVISPDNKYSFARFGQYYLSQDYICRSELNDEQNQYDFCYPTNVPKFWNFSMGEPVISPDGKVLVTRISTDREGSSLYFWDVETGTILHEEKDVPSNLADLQFGPDGSMLLGTSGSLIYIMDPANGKKEQVISGLANWVDQFRFSKDADKLIIIDRHQQPIMYQFSTNQFIPYEIELDNLPYFTEYEKSLMEDGYWASNQNTASFTMANAIGIVDNVSKLAFSSDDTKFAVGSGNIQVRDVKTRQLLNALYLERDFYLRDLVFSPDGNLLGAVTSHGDVYIWNLSNNDIIFELVGNERLTYLEKHAYDIQSTFINDMVYENQSLAFSPNGEQIALQNGPNIEIWNIKNKELYRQLDEINLVSVPTKFSFTDNGNEMIAVINLDEAAAVWSTETGELIRQMQFPEVDIKLDSVFAYQAGFFARSIHNHKTEENSLQIWDIANHETYEIPNLPFEPNHMNFNHQGTFLAIDTVNDQVYLLNTASMEIKFIPNQSDYLLDEFAINSDGALLLRENYTDFLNYDSKTGPMIWNLKYSNENYPLFTPTPSFNYGSSGGPAATPFPYEEIEQTSSSITTENPISAENINKMQFVVELGKGKIINAIWSDDMKELHIISSKGYYLLDAQTLELKSQYEPDALVVTDGAISENGHIILCGTSSPTQIEVWDMSDKKRLVQLQSTQKPALSTDGNLLVYLIKGEGSYIWNILENHHVAFIENYSIDPKPVFSSDHNYMTVSSGFDKRILIVDLYTGKIVNEGAGSDADITSLQFSPDNKFLVGTDEGAAYVWPVDPNLPSVIYPIFEGIIDIDVIYFNDTVESITMNPDATIVAIGTSNRDILLYDVTKNNLLGKISASDGIADQLFYSHDGLQILAADKNGRLILWNAITGYHIATSYLFSNTISDLTPSIDGNMISIIQNMATTFNPSTGEEISHVVISSQEIFAASPAGNYLAGYTPIQVSLYNARDGSQIITLPEKAKETDLMRFETWRQHPEQKFYGADFSLDGSRLVTFAEGGWWIYDQGMLLTDIKEETELQTYTPISKMSQDGTLVIGTPEGSLRGFYMYKVKSGEYYGGVELGYWVLVNDAIEISSDKKWIGFLRSYSNCSNAYGCDFDFILADPLNGSEEDFLKLNIYSDSEQNTFAFNQNTTLAAVAHSNGVISIVSIPDMEILYSFKAHFDDIISLAFSMDDSRLISADENGIIRIWAAP